MSQSKPKTEAEERQQRLAQALRQNLLRRKQQARGRSVEKQAENAPEGVTKSSD